MLFNLLQSGIDTLETVGEAVPQQQEMTMSLFDLFLKGGALMWVLLALSVIAIYIFGKKWWILRGAGKIDPNFMKDIKDLIIDGKTRSATALCQRYDTPVARMVEKGIDRMGRPLQDIQTAVENTGNVEVSRLEKGLPILATIAGGMVQAFFNMANAGNNIDITLLSGGIYTAMITTVGGLIVGIPAYFGYNYLTSKISDIVFKMESVTIDFMDVLNESSENK